MPEIEKKEKGFAFSDFRWEIFRSLYRKNWVFPFSGFRRERDGHR